MLTPSLIDHSVSNSEVENDKEKTILKLYRASGKCSDDALEALSNDKSI